MTRTRLASLIPTSWNGRWLEARPQYTTVLSGQRRASVGPDNQDLRAAPWLAIDLQQRIDGLGALAHDAHPQMIARNMTRIEPPPVVGDAQLNRLRQAAQAYHRLSGAGMARNIIQGLL